MQRIGLLSLYLIVGISSLLNAEQKRYALIVGVQTYRSGQPLSPLSYTENDADGLAEALKAGGYDVTLMTQSVGRLEGKEVFAPISDYIRDQIGAILENPNLGLDDVVLIAFAGHGVQFDLISENNIPKPHFYFCPADADIRNVASVKDITPQNRLIDLNELYEALKACSAGAKLLLVDACRNDPSKPQLARSVASSTLPPIPPPPGGTAVYFSCSANQMAFEDPDLQHGVFFHYVIEALKGGADSSTSSRPADRKITLAELSEHVSETTYDFVRKKYNGARQAPELKGQFRISIPILEIQEIKIGAKLMTVPFSSAEAAASQIAWAEKLGEPVEIKTPSGPYSIALRLIPPGTFRMGSPTGEKGRNSDEQQVDVTLTNHFWIGMTEVTENQWSGLMNTTPWHTDPNTFPFDSDAPASKISAFDADKFCEMLTQQENTAGRLPNGWTYRLPTEAEWEYSCRAGTESPFFIEEKNLKTVARFSTWGFELSEIKKPNPWGLKGMHGNVAEWCADVYNKQLPGGRDPISTEGEFNRVLRGGSFDSTSEKIRSAARDKLVPIQSRSNVGFRIVLAPK